MSLLFWTVFPWFPLTALFGIVIGVVPPFRRRFGRFFGVLWLAATT
tara:strand:- start:386 stop:523 length:138 start_codon:yes stop_codon:yes gene_type:complete